MSGHSARKFIALSLAIGLVAALYTKFIAKPTYHASYQFFFQEESGGLWQRDALGIELRLRLGGGSASSRHTVQEFITSRDNIQALAMTAISGGLSTAIMHEQLKKTKSLPRSLRSNFGANQRYTDSFLLRSLWL